MLRGPQHERTPSPNSLNVFPLALRGPTEHLETFLAEARLRGGGEGLPGFVEGELVRTVPTEAPAPRPAQVAGWLPGIETPAEWITA